MLLHVHKELANGIDMVEVANLFVGDNQRRKQLFGKFSKTDQPRSQDLFPGLGVGREKALGSAGHMISEHPKILGVLN